MSSNINQTDLRKNNSKNKLTFNSTIKSKHSNTNTDHNIHNNIYLTTNASTKKTKSQKLSNTGHLRLKSESSELYNTNHKYNLTVKNMFFNPYILQ